MACTAHMSMGSDSLLCHRQRRSYLFGVFSALVLQGRKKIAAAPIALTFPPVKQRQMKDSLRLRNQDYLHELYASKLLLSTNLTSIPRSRTLPGGGPSWAYLPYSPLERESKVECRSKHKRANRLCTRVYVLITLNLCLIICYLLIYPSIVRKRRYTARTQRHETSYVHAAYETSTPVVYT